MRDPRRNTCRLQSVRTLSMSSSLGLYHCRRLAVQETREEEQKNLKRHCVCSTSICLPPLPRGIARHRKGQWLRFSQYRTMVHHTLARVLYADHHHKPPSSYRARNPTLGHLSLRDPPRPTRDTRRDFCRLSRLPLPPHLDYLNQTSQTNIRMRPHHRAAYRSRTNIIGRRTISFSRPTTIKCPIIASRNQIRPPTSKRFLRPP